MCATACACPFSALPAAAFAGVQKQGENVQLLITVTVWSAMTHFCHHIIVNAREMMPFLLLMGIPPNTHTHTHTAHTLTKANADTAAIVYLALIFKINTHAGKLLFTL